MTDNPCSIDNAEKLARMIIDQIADKWSLLVIAALYHQPMRFNALKRELNGVTQKALTQALRRLERNGIIVRHVNPQPPIAVQYSITPLGRSLIKPVEALFQWTREYGSEVEAARLAYDKAVDNDAAAGAMPDTPLLTRIA